MSERTARILVTGGTGFLGSHIAAGLLGEGCRISFLARSSRTIPARVRVARLADWLGIGGEARERTEIVEGDLLESGWMEPALGGPAGRDAFDEIVHCASDTSFVERKRPELEAINIGGLRNILDFAARSGCPVFHYVSTAYVAGRRTGLCPEEWVESASFTNVYEETKARGEILARDFCRREGIRLNVYRPSIVYGDSRTGRTLRFNAVYFPIKAAVMLRDIYEADIQKHGGKKASEMGVRIEADGMMFLPMRIEVGSRGGLNLIPVDYCVAAFLALRKACREGGIFHIVHPESKRIEDIIGYAERFFHLGGIEACAAETFEARPKNALETLYHSYLEAYRPYMQDQRIFETRRSGPILEKRGLPCPEFDEGMFRRCMGFAVEAGWGTRLFPAHLAL